MRARVGVFWQRLRESLWVLPTVITVAAVALAAGTVELDRRLMADQRADFYLAFGGGAEGARGVLTAIGSTVITVTGVIFSVTIVALQLASSQFTPRVLRAFVGDRNNQVVLGVFIGTFIYTLLVLRTVRSAAEDRAVFVPSVSVAVAIGLALVSIGLLIFFIHHVARSIQASVVIDRAARDTQHLVDRLFPDSTTPEVAAESLADLVDDGLTIPADRAGYIQAVDEDGLFALACQAKITVRMERRVGEHLLPGTPLVSFWPSARISDDVAVTVRKAFVVGPERTLIDDLELGIRQLTDIALRALSPSLNDATTAMICFDRLAEIVVRVGSRPTPATLRRSNGGCLVIRRQTFEDVADGAFGLTRRSVAADPVVARHVVATLGRIGVGVRPEYRPALAAHLDALLATVESMTSLPFDLEPIRSAGLVARRVLCHTAGGDAPPSTLCGGC